MKEAAGLSHQRLDFCDKRERPAKAAEPDIGKIGGLESGFDIFSSERLRAPGRPIDKPALVVIERQQLAVNKLVQWCDDWNGRSIFATKSSCVHFCRKRGLHLSPEIPVVYEVQFLGVIFDRRLTFLPHILHFRKKFLNLLRVLSNVTTIISIHPGSNTVLS
ncbi:putative RNA-directed DNA polymerase from transposon X-element [Trichonephila clavipes]|nr:putative RNA-directed DNA polymerase from transposon X-element [Trichonephila clavipes]